MFNLKNKVAIVTGAGGFLGKNFCKFLISYGANVIAIDVNNKSLKELKKLIIHSSLNVNKLQTIKCNIINVLYYY